MSDWQRLTLLDQPPVAAVMTAFPALKGRHARGVTAGNGAHGHIGHPRRVVS